MTFALNAQKISSCPPYSFLSLKLLFRHRLPPFVERSELGVRFLKATELAWNDDAPFRQTIHGIVLHVGHHFPVNHFDNAPFVGDPAGEESRSLFEQVGTIA